jgi:hypothetical protein
MRLSTLRVVEPCHADWDAMSGDAHARHCEHCRLQVTDLSELTRGEAEDLLARGGPDGRLCVRYTQDAAGAVVTRTTRQERLVGLLQRLAAQKSSAS